MTFLYIMTGRLTSGDAAATRIISFCNVLKEIGKEVMVISLDEVRPYQTNIYKGIRYITLASNANTTLGKVLNRICFKNRLKKVLGQFEKKGGIEGVFFYDMEPHIIIFLKKYTRKHNIRIFHDSVEWYSPDQFKFGKLAMPYIMKDFLNRYLIDKQLSVFAISQYLYDHFNSEGIRVIRIPIMLDIDEIAFEKKIQHDKLIISYAGSPGKKDYLQEMVEGLSALEQADLQKVNLHIFGVNKEQLTALCGVSEEIIRKCGDSLIVHGWVSRQEVLEFLKQTHFTVLLRQETLRYAKAGFPTKVVESLATGTPIICNISSDLGMYLIDGKNAMIVKNCTAGEFKNTLLRALLLTLNEREQICNNARKTAEIDFNYKKFKEQFETFIR